MSKQTGKAFALAVVGTAKNTGKTTVIRVLLEAANVQRIPLGLTGIGYDGEAIDNITGLPKPRLLVDRGVVVATAHDCLKAGSALVEILRETEATTPLGRVIIGRIERPGLVIIAGPHTGQDLRMVMNILANLGCDLVLVDGAVNRMAPLMWCDGLIVATGAARSQNTALLSREAEVINTLFNLPVAHPERMKSINLAAITVRSNNGSLKTLPTSSLLAQSTVDDLMHLMGKDASWIVIPGVVTTACLQMLSQKIADHMTGMVIVVSDPIRLFIGGDPVLLQRTLLQIWERGGQIQVLRQLPLIAITINPFYPLWRGGSQGYEPDWVDPEELRRAIASVVDVPVLDVIRQEGDYLFDLVREHTGRDTAAKKQG